MDKQLYTYQVTWRNNASSYEKDQCRQGVYIRLGAIILRELLRGNQVAAVREIEEPSPTRDHWTIYEVRVTFAEPTQQYSE